MDLRERQQESAKAREGRLGSAEAREKQLGSAEASSLCCSVVGQVAQHPITIQVFNRSSS